MRNKMKFKLVAFLSSLTMVFSSCANKPVEKNTNTNSDESVSVFSYALEQSDANEENEEQEISSEISRSYDAEKEEVTPGKNADYTDTVDSSMIKVLEVFNPETNSYKHYFVYPSLHREYVDDYGMDQVENTAKTIFDGTAVYKYIDDSEIYQDEFVNNSIFDDGVTFLTNVIHLQYSFFENEEDNESTIFATADRTISTLYVYDGVDYTTYSNYSYYISEKDKQNNINNDFYETETSYNVNNICMDKDNDKYLVKQYDFDDIYETGFYTLDELLEFKNKLDSKDEIKLDLSKYYMYN